MERSHGLGARLGLNLAHQGDVVFVTWVTYDLSGKAWWLSMAANRIAGNTYSGTFYQTHGPAYNAAHFDSSRVTLAAVGTGTLTFSGADTALRLFGQRRHAD